MTFSNTRVDKLGNQLKGGGLDAHSLVRLSDYRDSFALAYQRVESLLRDKLGKDVSGRPAKSTTAIIEKLRRESIRLSQMQDIAGCRVIVNGLHSQDALVDTLGIMLSDARLIDRRREPSHGYRAVHVITVTDGRPVEIQIRTKLQHLWADLSEKLADSYGQDIKYGKGNPAAVKFLADLGSETERLERIRYDRNMVRAGGSMKFYRESISQSKSKLEKELARTDRVSVYKIGALLSREIEL